MKPQGVLVCLFFYLLYPANIIGLWWAVGSPLVMDPNSICRKSRRLAGKQQEICRKEPEIVREVAHGAKMAVRECQYQFRNRKWNCTTTHRSFGKILQLDIRETAFVNAMTAAGVVYTVTQACSMGLLLQCSCDNRHRNKMRNAGDWEWGGCDDNVEFGYQKSKEFMDAVPKSRRRRGDIRTLIHLHNNEAGRLSVRDFMRRECKCHGLSGSCALKTCWVKMPIFRNVGARLKERFDGAAKVIGSNDGKRLIPEGDTIKPPGHLDLIYSEESPDFCRPNRRMGSLGTRGRDCNPHSLGVEGCDLLCCGRGHEKMTLHIKSNCKCRFMWCCEVICQTCVTTLTVHRCL